MGSPWRIVSKKMHDMRAMAKIAAVGFLIRSSSRNIVMSRERMPSMALRI